MQTKRQYVADVCVHFTCINVHEIWRSCRPMVFSNHLVDSRWLSPSEKWSLEKCKGWRQFRLCGEAVACYLPNGSDSTALQGHVVRGETH